MDTVNTTHILPIAGELISFPRITVAQIEATCNMIQAERETNARMLAAEMKLSTNEIFNVLFEIRARKVTGAELLALCEVPSVAIHIIGLSYGGDSKERKEELARVMGLINLPDMTNLAKALILELDPIRPEETLTDEEKAAKAKEAATNSPLDGGSGQSIPATAPAEKASTSTTITVQTGKGSVQIPAGYGSNP